MRVFEIVLDGFNGDTDKTDHLVLWVTAPDPSMVIHAIGEAKATVSQFEDQYVGEDDIDFALPQEFDKLRARITGA